jgi:hypothetical protein
MHAKRSFTSGEVLLDLDDRDLEVSRLVEGIVMAAAPYRRNRRRANQVHG